MTSGYRRLWLALACAVAAPGVVVRLAADAAWPNVAAAATVGVGVAAIAISAYDTGSRSAGSRIAVAAGAAGAGISFAVSGLYSLFGPNALLLPLLFAVTSPPALRGLVSLGHGPNQPPRPERARRRDVKHRRPDPSRAPSRPSPRQCPRSLSDAELLRAWGASTDLADDLGGDDHRMQQLHHLAIRQQYLDELERRHPESFRRWLTDGASASRGPDDVRFLDDHGDDHRRRDSF